MPSFQESEDFWYYLRMDECRNFDRDLKIKTMTFFFLTRNQHFPRQIILNTLCETPCISLYDKRDVYIRLRYTHLSRNNEFCPRVVCIIIIYIYIYIRNNTETRPPPESETNITVMTFVVRSIYYIILFLMRSLKNVTGACTCV